LGARAARSGDLGRRSGRADEAHPRVFAPLRRIVPRAAHAPGRRAALRVLPSARARCLDRGAGAPAFRGDRGAHARHGAERRDLHSHRTDLGPRVLRRPGARPLSVDLASVIRPGDALLWGQACAEPQTLVEALIAQRAALSGCRAFIGSSYSDLLRPEHADHLRLTSYCGTGSNRALSDAGVLDLEPSPYSQFGALIRSRRIACDVALVQVSPPNARGEYSLGLAVEYLAPALEVARALV